MTRYGPPFEGLMETHILAYPSAGLGSEMKLIVMILSLLSAASWPARLPFALAVRTVLLCSSLSS